MYNCNMNNMVSTIISMNNCNNICSNNTEMGYISVVNRGAYLAVFWGTYEYNGQTISFSVDLFPVGQERRVYIPLNATNIHVVMQAAVFLWAWQLICDKYFSIGGKYCFITYGSSLIPYCAQVPCNP